MPEIKEFFDANAEKKVLTTFFPAIVALWPVYIVITQDYYELSGDLKQLNTTLNVVFFALFFIVMYGVGHFIHKLALRAEVGLDDWYCRLDVNCKPVNISAEMFEAVWYKYLQQKFDKENPPILLKYYSSFITYYHFELTCIIALRIQIILLTIIDIYYFDVLSESLFWGIIITIAVSIGFIHYLRFEGQKAVETAHTLREKLIEINDPRFTLLLNNTVVTGLIRPMPAFRKWAANILFALGFSNCLPYARTKKVNTNKKRL